MKYNIYRIKGKKRINLARSISITNWIIIINIIFYFVASLLVLAYPNFFKLVSLRASDIINLKYIWTILTSMFMHGNLTHLFVNMISLLFIGNFVEKIIGKKRFLPFYLISGITAGLFFVLIAFIFKINMDVSAVGASGAIFALGGLLAILIPRLKVLVFFIIPMPMWLAMIVLLFGLWAISLSARLPIGNIAHLGGLLTGLAYGIYLRIKYKEKIKMLNRIFSQ